MKSVEEFIQSIHTEFDLDVSRETRDRFFTYFELLIKWQKAINLVSNKTLEEAWDRHFYDSAQLFCYITPKIKALLKLRSEQSIQAGADIAAELEKINLVDIGSGAGFPGMVLSILYRDPLVLKTLSSDVALGNSVSKNLEGGGVNVTLIESDQKKCEFLRHVSREADLKIDICNERIEVIAQGKDKSAEAQVKRGIKKPDIVTARALAELKKLLELSYPWAERNPHLSLFFLKGKNADIELEEAKKFYDFVSYAHNSHTDKDAVILEITALT